MCSAVVGAADYRANLFSSGLLLHSANECVNFCFTFSVLGCKGRFI